MNVHFTCDECVCVSVCVSMCWGWRMAEAAAEPNTLTVRTKLTKVKMLHPANSIWLLLLLLMRRLRRCGCAVARPEKRRAHMCTKTHFSPAAAAAAARRSFFALALTPSASSSTCGIRRFHHHNHQHHTIDICIQRSHPFDAQKW